MRFALPRARSVRSLALVVATAFVLGACSGDSADLDDLADTLVDVTGLTVDQAACVAEELSTNPVYDEDLLTDLSDGTPETEEGQALQEQFEQDVATAVTVCVGSR